MNLLFVSVALNIHQVNIADELYRLTNGGFHFIETGDASGEHGKGGGDFSSRPSLVRVGESKVQERKALQLIRDADVMIYGAAPLRYLKERVKTGKLTFLYSERWLKRGWKNLLSPRLLQQQWFYHTRCHHKPVYALCASAYAASDFAKMFSFKNRCYKWGYFTAVPQLDIESAINAKSNASTAKILWVARFLQWKHPERMLQLASLLRKAGNYDFVVEMIGTGPEYDHIANQIKEQGLEDYVRLLGAMPNEAVLQKMRESHIFCFTSDRNEGWGAVLGEAMSNGCCPVSSVETGSTPYLINDGVNGLRFNLNQPNDLCKKVLWLLLHPEQRNQMSLEAYKTMRDVWSPQNAAARLLQLCESLHNGTAPEITEGPCSKAEII